MNSQHILVANDEPGVTRTLKIQVESTGAFEVTISYRAIDPFRNARRLRPGLILLNVIVAGTEGHVPKKAA